MMELFMLVMMEWKMNTVLYYLPGVSMAAIKKVPKTPTGNQQKKMKRIGKKDMNSVII